MYFNTDRPKPDRWNLRSERGRILQRRLSRAVSSLLQEHRLVAARNNPDPWIFMEDDIAEFFTPSQIQKVARISSKIRIIDLREADRLKHV